MISHLSKAILTHNALFLDLAFEASTSGFSDAAENLE